MAQHRRQDRTVGRKIVNDQTDVYNFGATMYRLVTFRLPPSTVAEEGGLPLDAKTWAQLLTPVNEHNPKAPPALCDLIGRCLSWNAVKRPERMGEVQGILDHLCDDLVTSPEDRLEAMEW